MKRWSSFVACLLMFSSSVASAYVPSEQNGAFELKFGPYRPDMKNHEQAYKTAFNNDMMFLTALELDWQFWHPPGFSVGVGGSVGFMQAVAKARMLEDADTGERVLGERSADSNVLNVMPFALLLVIRADVLADELRVPLVPYFKAGLNWYYWWILEGGDVPSSEGMNGKGGTLGWQLNPGIMFRLDPLDERSARTFDNEVGVNHSYIFVELNYARVDRFGSGSSYMDFSELMFTAGLALEF